MRNDRKLKIVSVESRKGGVGKTTAALNLAYLGLQKKYRVIFLDLDITGTESGVFDTVPIWEHAVNVVKDEKGKEKVNLVAMFEEFMTGKPFPEISIGAGGNGLTLEKDQVNIFSSFLSRDGEDGKNGGKGHKYAPAILFDELHSIWFREMLEELIAKARAVFGEPKKGEKGLLVVIDNAPGYSGLEPMVEEWLTDLGPECGKFLMVGSLDPQDFKACAQALSGIQKKYLDKWSVSRDLIKFSKNETKEDALESIEPLGGRKVFFQRLAETMPATPKCEYYITGKSPDDCTDCGFCFYRQPINEGKRYSKLYGEKFKITPSSYLGIVFNKVNEAISKKIYIYYTESILKMLGYTAVGQVPLRKLPGFLKENCSEVKHPVPSDVFEKPYDKLIPFRQDYSVLFMVNLLEKGNADDDISIKSISDETFELKKNLIKEIHHAKRVFSQKISKFVEGNAVENDVIELEIIVEFDESVRTIEKKLVESGIKNAKDFFIESFSPLMIRTQQIKFWIGIIKSVFPDQIHDHEIEKFLIFKTTTNNLPNVNKIIDNIQGEIEKNEADDGVKLVDYSAIRTDISKDIAIAQKIVNKKSKKSFSKKPSLIANEISRLYSTLYNEVWSSLLKGKRMSQIRYVKALKEVEGNVIGMIDHMLVSSNHYTHINDIEWITSELLAKNFIDFCEVQLRVWIMPTDHLFLMDCYMFLVYLGETTHEILGRVKDEAVKVVVDKAYKREKGLQMLRALGMPTVTDLIHGNIHFPEKGVGFDLSAVKKMKEMEDFETVLGGIIDKWKL